MAAAADLTLKNNAAANVTYNVYSVEPDAVEWVESGASSILGTPRFRLNRKVPTDKAKGIYRGTGKLTYPVLNATTGALDGVVTMNFDILRPANLTNTVVDEAYARFKEAVAQAIVKTMAESGAIPT